MTFLRRGRGESGEGFVRVCALAEISPGEIRSVEGRAVVLCRTREGLYALSAVCPHSAAKLVAGRILGGCIECPLHGARFALGSGEVLTGPARRALASYDVEIREGQVWVATRPRRLGLLAWIRRELRAYGAAGAGGRRRAR